MLVVTGDTERVLEKLPGYDFVEPASYARLASLLASGDSIIVY